MLAKQLRNLLLLSILFFINLAAQAQTTYTWIGGNGAWNVAGNWSGGVVPLNSNLSIVEFNNSGTYTVTAVPAQTIRQLLVTNNTNVTLQAAATNILTINGPTLTNNLVVENGATLQTSATNALTITMTTTANQRADISGTLNVRAGGFTTNAIASNIFTVSATGVVNHFGGTITGSAATLVFEDNSNYNYLGTGALTIPTANWATNSNINITGITTAATIGGISGQSFGNCTYNCTSQGNVAVTFAVTLTTTRFKGNFNLQSTGAGTGSLSFKNGTGAVTLNVDGLFNQSGGTMNANIGGTAGLTLNLNGGYSQSGGTFNSSTANIACTINIAGSFDQSGGVFTRTAGTTLTTINFTSVGDFIISGGTHTNTLLNYSVAANGNLTLQNNLVLANSRQFTVAANGRLNFGTYNISGVTTTTFSVAAGGTISIGDQLGITTTGATGNVQTNTRTFTVGANFIYAGTNGQVTGNGCPANVTGSITLNLQNFTDQLTITNTAAIGAAGLMRLVSGSLANAITYNATGRLEYAGTQAQTTTNNEFPATSGPAGLIINNPNGVTLHASRSLPATAAGVLTLQQGTLNTTTTEVLSVLQAAVAAVVGGSSSTYVNGPLIRAINAIGNYNFPVGDGAVYGGYSIQTTAAASGVNLRVQFVNSASGTVGNGLTALENYHWRVERTAGTTAVTYTPLLTIAGLVADSRVGYSTTVAGAYANQGGSNIGASITSVLTNTIDNANPNAYYSVGTSGTLSGTISALNLTTIADLLRTQLVTGNVIFELPTTYTGEPAYPVNFTAFTEDGGGPYNVTIRLEALSSAKVTAGDPGTANPLIDLNGIDRITFDGRAGGTGPIEWTFRNTRFVATFGPTFRFINGATSNTLMYLNIESQNTLAASGTILFSTSTALLGGNSNNIIEYCNIRENTANNATPANGIHSSGTAGALNENNIIRRNNIRNFFVSGSTHTGILIAGQNAGWLIERNSFFQTISRANGAGSFNAISISNTGDNFIVRHNYIGGSEPLAAGTPLTYTGTGAGTFFGVDLNPATTATGCVVDSNLVANISFSRGTSTTAVSFVGIRNANGAGLIADNLIGSTSANGNITITENFATTPSTSNGIINSAGNSTLERNTISGITLAGSGATVGHSFNGILISVGICSVNQNTIGSSTLANSIHCNIASTNATGQFLNGINYTSITAGTTHIIANNTIANLTNNVVGAAAASNIRGIATSSSGAGGFTITGNSIFNLSIAGASVGVDVNAVAIGIQFQRALVGQNISQNTIHSISATHLSAANSVIGIHYSGPTTGTNNVSRNNIHSLSLATSTTTSRIIGINAFVGIANYHNNMIRLGIDASGASITTGFNIAGIQQTSATANNRFIYNSVYVGGTGVAGVSNTYAFNKTSAAGLIDIRNNIFVNNRSNISGTNFNYAIGFGVIHNPTQLANLNNNLYNFTGVGGRVAEMPAGTGYSNMVAWQTVAPPVDNQSLVGPAGFINPTGDASAVNLRINPVTPTQVESGGVAIAGFDNDIDLDIRQGSVGYAGTGSAPDIGADEGEFTAIDITPPLIVYTVIPTQTSFVGPTLSATITDANLVEVAAGLAPRIYFKRSTDLNEFNDNTSGTDGWKFVESPTGSSPFALTLDYSLLFGGTGVSAGSTIQYFVVAQDNSSNVAINSGTFAAAPSNVQLTSAQFPMTGTINEFFINVLNGTYTVGTGGDFTSLTNAGGLFQTINTGSLSGNVIAEITSDLLVESGLHPLNQWIEINGSGYTLTIRPSAAATRTISGTFNGDLYRLDGADRVTIDGNFGGSGRHLIFTNTSATAGASTIAFLNEATNNTIRNAFLRGSGTSTTRGVVFFSTSTAVGSAGNSSNTIEFCDIHQNASALPTNGIFSAGTAAKLNVNNTINNNNIYNFFSATGGSNGISLAGNTSAWTIENNRFYQEATRTTTTASTFHYVININNTANANTVIRGNYIGGSAADGSGTMTYTAAVGNQLAPIYLNTNSTTANAAIVENNTITSISFTTLSAATSGIGPFTAIYQLGGASRILGNTIGSTTGNGAITVNVNTNSNGVVNAIRYDGTATVKIENNNIGSITVNGTGTNNGTSFFGVNIAAGSVAVKNNLIGSSTAANSIQINGTATSNASVLGGINLVATATYLDSVITNTIANLTNFNGGTATRILGISATSGAQYIINDNTIRNLNLTASTNIGITSTPAVLGIALVTANTQLLSVARNTIHSLTNGGSGASAFTTGIHYNGGTNANNVVESNFIHSLSPSLGASATVVGLQISGGTTTNVRNNKIRLGINAAGAGIAQAHTLYGIDVISTSTTNVFHNSVYIGGAVAATTALNSIALRRTATTGTINIQNNILMNARTQASGGKHYCISSPNITTYTSNYNILYPIGTGTFVGLFNTTDALTLAIWRTLTTNRDLNSSSCDPAFENPTGTATTLDLHLNATTGTAAEGRGNPVALTPPVLLDFDGETRDTPALNTVDIGADAGNYIPLSGPTLNALANSVNPFTTCSGNTVTFTSNATGGSFCAAWQYSWFNGSQYWNGTDFASATELFNTSWASITAPVSIGGTYTVRANCSGDLENCISTTQSTVVINLNTSPTTLTPVIGNPADGPSHFIEITWPSVSGTTAYNLEFSTDNITWNSLYSGTNLSFSHNTGDSPNAPYYYRVRSVFGAETCNWTNATTFPIHTAADAPNVVVLTNATSFTMDLALQAETPVANPSTTTYSIFCPTNNLFVQANGSLGVTEVFQTFALWGTTTVTGLIPNTEYCFLARARNNDGDVREGLGSNALGVETFTTSANFATGINDLTRFWSPSTCTTGGLQYFATDGCTDGYVGRTGAFTNFFGCFLRTPEVNCTGNASMKIFLDVSNSFFASQPNDRIRFYMWADNQFVSGACTSIKINGIEVSQTDINGRFLPFNVARNCVNVEVTFNLSSVINKSAVLFYAEPSNAYNNANVFSVKLDNISVFGGPPPTCLSTAPLVLNGDYTVGSGGDFPSLTNAGGLFEAVNQATLSGNVTATVISDLTAESGTFALNQWVESGLGNYTLTLRPSNNTNRIIEGNYVGANAAFGGLFRINGADRFIIDGRDPANLGAGGRHLLFRNLSTTNSAFNSTFNFLNDATTNTFRYIVAEGGSTATTNTNGVIRFSTSATTGSGNDNNTIEFCQIRDLSSVAGLPINGIYALGTNGRENNNITISNNEIFNVWSATTQSSSGILIEAGNTQWTISNNSIYQTATRNATATSIHYGILIDNSTNGNDFQVLDNSIGGTSPLAAGTPWNITGTAQVGFMGISINIMTSAASLVQGNTITNFNINSTRISAFPTNTFNGILSASNGATTINNNTIGSTTGNGAITINNASTVNAFSMIVGIGHSTSTGDVNITNNNVGSFTLNSSSSYPVSFNGIRYGQGGSGSNRTISGNLIGSLTTTNSIEVNTNSNITSAQDVIGINMTGGANAVSITNNTIANMHNNRPSANAGQIIGISSAFATNTITGNNVFNLTSTSISAATGSSAAVIGISLSATSANNHLISQNTINSLRSTAVSAATSVVGIYYGSSTGTSNNLSRNLVHSLSSASSGASVISGIYLGAGNMIASNNMVRLGIDASGNSLTASHVYHGIVKDNTANNNQIYYNSVYIGGSGVSSLANATYAFRRLQTGAGDNVRNNIFFNARANATTGGKHYGVYLNNASTLTMSHNLIFTNGNGGVFGGVGAADYASLALWQIGTSFGSNTVSADPSFVNPTAGTPDLRLTVGSANAAESGAVEIVGLTDDFDATNVRTGYPQTSIHGGGTAPDMGADETDMIPVDVTPPNFSYTFIPTQSAACSPIVTSVNVTIIDGQTGISLTNDLPRMYFRRRVGAPTTTWSFANSIQGTYVSGTSNNSVWNFTLDYALFGITPATANEFEYYFVAQDQAAITNVGTSQTNGTSPLHSNVSTLVTPAAFAFGASGSYVFAGTPLSGTVTVGTSGDYATFNGASGLFNAINTLGLSGDLEVLVISNINELANWTPLNAPNEFCGAGYTITIRPNAATLYTIEANASAANAMFSFYGARRVVIDGRFSGSGRFLRLRHNRVTAIYASTIEYNNGANNNVLRSCIIEGANTNNQMNTTGSVGVVRIGGSMGFASGNLNNITIEDNEIRNPTNVTPSLTNVPNILVYLGGASASANINNITITGNDFTNFQGSAIHASNGSSVTNSIGNNIFITNNNIYQELIVPTYQYPIWLDGVGNTFGHVISGNKIGGSAKPNPNITGTWQNNKGDGEVVAIFANVGNAPTQAEALSIQGNKIQNINISGTGWTNFVGMRIQNGRVRIGDEIGNVIGSEDNSPDNIISNGSGGSFITEDAGVLGIWTQSSEEVVIENNIISGLSTGLGTFCFVDGIAHGSNLYYNGVLYNAPGGKSTIKNNVIANNRSSSNLQNSAVSNEAMLSLFVHTNAMDNLIEGNLIQNNGANALVNNNVRNHGVLLGILGQTQNHGGIFRNNTIAALANANAGQVGNVAPEINGLVLNHGNWEVSNNMISLRNGTTGTNITNRNTVLIGIRDHLRNLTGQGATYLYNSVYIYGVNGINGTANASYNYLRLPNNAGNVAGAPVTLRNNLFVNNRSGTGAHRAIGNVNASVPGTNWNAASSNYNFISTLTAGTATRWGTTDYNITNWRTISGGDANTNYIPAGATTIANTQLLPTDLFESDYLFGNLRISLLNTDATNFIDNLGTPVAVTTDIDGDIRNVTTPDIGADEFNLCAAPTVTLQPTDQLNICVGSNATFTTTVTGFAPLTYQWQESTDGGATWGNLADAGIYSGTATNALTLTGVTAGLNNIQYRLNIVNTCGNATSNTALLTIPAGPAISGYSPISLINSICSGNTNFQVTATGNGLTYQWQESTDNGTTWANLVNVAPYSGATTNQLDFSNIPPPNLDGNRYRVIITDNCGNQITSLVMTLNVGVAFITAQPVVQQSVCEGSTVNISVSATGSTVNFIWQVSTDGGSTWNNTTGPVYSGNTTSTLAFTAAASMNNYRYRVIVNSSCNVPTNSDVSILNVEYPGLWLGNGTNWDTPSNWGCGVVPTNTTNVLIPTNPINGIIFPEVGSANTSQVLSLLIENSASVTVLTGSDLSVYGNITNNGVASLGAGLIRLRGNTLQTIGGTSQLAIASLTLDNTATSDPAVELNNSISVNNTLDFIDGNLNLNGFDINLNGTGVFTNETNSSRVYGSSGEVKTVITLSASTNYANIAGLGIGINTGTTAPGVTQIDRGHFQHTHIGTYQSIQRYFDISPSTNAALDATLRMYYFDDEMAVTLGPPAQKANLLPWRSTDGGATWSGQFFPSNLSNDVVNNWVQLTSIPAFSRWTLSDWILQPLPIELLSFTATANQALNQVDLNWVTASEINNEYFTVERSKDAQLFIPVLVRSGAGNSNSIITYNDVDLQPYTGLSYYRLKQTDYNGAHTYSQIVPVNFSNNQLSTLNGLFIESGDLYLNHFASSRGGARIEVMDAAGRNIFQGIIQANEGSNTYQLPASEWSPGIYMIRLIQDGEALPLKVVKSK